MTEKTGYHHGDLRAALLSAALTLLDEGGVEAVTIRAVARAAGVAHSAPANHFRDRKALLTALATGLFRTLAAELAADLATAPAERRAGVRVFARRWLAFGLAHPNRYRLMWRRDCLHEDTELEAAMDAIYDPLVALLAKGRKPNDAHVSAESEAIALWSLMHGYLSMRLDGNLTEGTDEISGAPRQDALLAVLWDGLAGG